MYRCRSQSIRVRQTDGDRVGRSALKRLERNVRGDRPVAKRGDGNVWEVSDGGLSLEVGTNVEYAAYVNDGHWTNPKGVDRRFAPGTWEGDRFVYDPGAKTGMVLKQKWVEGAHYFDSAVRIFEKMFPDILEAKLQEWIDSYFGEFI